MYGCMYLGTDVCTHVLYLRTVVLYLGSCCVAEAEDLCNACLCSVSGVCLSVRLRGEAWKDD